MSARAIPCAMAPACPLVPPPATLTLTSNFRCVLVTRSGALAASSRTRRPRNASRSLSLTVILPSPGWIRTRATAFLRRPVPRLKVSAKIDVSPRVECDLLRLLGHVLVIGPGVDAKAGEHVSPQRVPLEHALHRVGDRKCRVELLGLAQRSPAEPAWVAAVVGVLLGGHLRAGDLHLGGVDHDHVVAGVQVWREGPLVLAPPALGHPAPQPGPNP